MISIIVPVYNTAPYLNKCIESIINQTYTDLEVLLIDDCSTDGSAEILDYWAERDPRIHVMHKEKNSGVSDSRNIALRTACGEYVGFVDSDDWLEPEMFAEMQKLLEVTGADVAFSGYNRIGASDVLQVMVSEPSGNVLPADDALMQIIPQRGTGAYNLFTWNKVFRKKALKKDGELILFDTRYSYGEDVLWLTRVLLNCKKIVFWQGCGYNYRADREGNTWTALSQFNNMARCVSAMEANKEMHRLLYEAGSKSENNQLQRVLIYQCFTFRTAAHMKDLEACRRYREGYLSTLLRWYAGNRSLIGLLWFIKQLGSDLLFQISMVR